jgi:16S rRNA processing protein RimM
VLLVGIVRRPHGLGGEVSVEIVTDFPERFVPGGKLTWQRGAEVRALEIAAARPHSGRLLVTFMGVDGVEAARALTGGELLIPDEEASPAPLGFYYSHQIEGFRCEDPRGRPLGVVRDLSKTPAGPTLTLETTAGKEAFVPFVEEMVREIDSKARRIVLDLPEGLLDL